MEAQKLAYSIPEASALSGRSRADIYRALNARELAAKKRGRRTIILADELRRWLSALKPYEPRPRSEPQAA
jgi:hypothetical protein